MPLFRRHTKVVHQDPEPLHWDADELLATLPDAVYSFGPVPISPSFDALIRESVAESEHLAHE